MSFVVSNLTIGLPPIWVDTGVPLEGPGVTFGSHNIHTEDHFLSDRRECRTFFTSIFQPGTLEALSRVRHGHVDYEDSFSPGPNPPPVTIFGMNMSPPIPTNILSPRRFWEYVKELACMVRDYLFMDYHMDYPPYGSDVASHARSC